MAKVGGGLWAYGRLLASRRAYSEVKNGQDLYLMW